MNKDSCPSPPDTEFFNLYRQGFIRVALGIPTVRVADPAYNVRATIEMAGKLEKEKAILAIFPELGLSGYTCEDLFSQESLRAGILAAVQQVVAATRDMGLIMVVGAPLVIGSGLFNCAVVAARGRIYGIAVKSFLPNYREFYEGRYFRSATELISATVDIGGQKDIPVGADLIFSVPAIDNFHFFIESCEDLWVPVPPSSLACLAGATVIGNVSASNVTLGKAKLRRRLAASQSFRCLAAYLYTAAGPGESSTDLAWDGQAMIYERGELLGEARRFSLHPQMLLADIDLDGIKAERLRQNTFGENLAVYRKEAAKFRRIEVAMPVPGAERLLLNRNWPRFPYLPVEGYQRDEYCFEAYHIQVHSLAKRLRFAGIDKIILGVSGGLDSSHALAVAARTMDLLELPRKNIKAYTMPGFATSTRTYHNAKLLMEAFGVEAGEIDIKPSCLQMMRDIGYRPPEEGGSYDATFENIQAGERASHLFRLANLHGGLVLGTGDLSELAQGWCTYGVGDQMSHYNVNSGLPKTFIQYLIRWVAETGQFDPQVSAILKDILATDISPELIPGGDENLPSQKTEEKIGPYELQDFNLYYLLRYGYGPRKIAFLSYLAWHDPARGEWYGLPKEKRHAYGIREIKKWLRVFLYNFFQKSQYKRSCLPNGPKVISGGSLSPRGDYRAPSDAEASVWLAEAALIPEEEENETVSRF
jgi:NAD+ synthase (glutamine-hydrolysing)